MDTSSFSFQNESQNEEIELTPAEALDQLELAWRNELLAPELLPNRADLVSSILERIHEMEDAVKKVEKGSLHVALLKMEMDRIRYVVTSYLRCRLRKIEKYIFHAVADDDKRVRDGRDPKMSLEEMNFATEYRTHLEGYFKAVALQRMPTNAQKLDREKMATVPNLDHFVFVGIRRKLNDVTIPSTTDDGKELEVDLDAQTQHIMSYKIASDLIKDGSAYLM